jgi:alcohol dehydrogenase class IV
VAVGQGPCADAAKWLNLVVSTGQETLLPFTGEQQVPRISKPLALIPSASADGFEVSGHLRSREVSLRSVNLMPQLVFVDFRACGQPDEEVMTETTLMALTHAVEAFFRADGNPMTSVYARTAARLAASALHQLAGRGHPHDRLNLTVAHAAALGGCALGSHRPGDACQLGAAVAESGRVSAAQATGIVLSYLLEHRAAKGALDADALLGLLGGIDRYTRTPEGQRGAAALYLLRDLMNQLFEKTDGRIYRTLQDTGLTPAEMKKAAGRVAAQAMASDPVVYETILAHAWAGRPFA